MRNVLFILLVGLLATTSPGEEFTMTFSTATISGGEYGNRNVVAAWVEKSDGTMVKTISRYGDRRANDMSKWRAASGGKSVDADAVMGATRPNHSAPSVITANWDLKDRSGTVVPDGDYKIWFNIDNGSERNHSFTFVKDANAGVRTNPGTTYFKNISINYAPPAPPTSANAGDDLTRYDSDNNGTEDFLLDASASVGSFSQFAWSTNGTTIATGESANVTLPLGFHEVSLVATYTAGGTEQDSVTVNVLADPANNGETIIYKHIFDGDNVPLNGTVADEGAGTWAANSYFIADGSTLSTGRGGAQLPFIPEEGKIYTLSLTYKNKSSTGQWTALHFSDEVINHPGQAADDSFLDGSRGIGSLLSKTTTDANPPGSLEPLQAFNGLGTADKNTLSMPAGFSPTNTHTLTVVLDTTNPDMTVQYFANGDALLSAPATPNGISRAAITHIGISGSDVDARLYGFTLTEQTPSADSDNDDMLDSWEEDHGLIVGIDDSGMDPDEDGLSNYAEFVAGTHPQQEGSVFALNDPLAIGETDMLISWSSVVGRTYAIQSIDDLLDTNGWNMIEENILATPPVNTSSVPVSVETRYFRVRIQQ